MKTLQSYVEGRWVAGSGQGRPLYNPMTEELIAEASTEGIDMGAAVTYARTRGGAALREMTFADRGRLLGEMAKAIHSIRDELLDLARINGGNTRGDAKFDIDGCTGTMAYYAKLGESLGDRHFLVEPESQQLTRSPRLVGQHILVPRQGVAVHINAFNFPGWGFGEKAAVALLAGVPVITKPATSTALVTERMIEVIVDAGILPDGALTLITGSVGDLLDHLEGQDTLAFTGSSDTAATIRAGQGCVAKSVHVNVEADSLNSAVLGSDVDRDAEVYDLFLREVTRDITQKAGQKCTAIRRILVPESMMDMVCDDLKEQLQGMPAGDPALREVKVGPLSTASQLRDIREGVERLMACTVPVLGDGGRGNLVGIDNDKGYFMSPVLLRAANAREAAAVHEHEVFGPVATVLPYSGDAPDAIDIIRLGGGGLVSSVYTDDAGFAEAMVMGMAPYHGRLTIGSSRVAEHSPGPGTVLPMMTHGGPGRAGGGEELGGERGLHFYLQRTAVQGFRPWLEKMFA